jgi:signal transduction histidine kinase
MDGVHRMLTNCNTTCLGYFFTLFIALLTFLFLETPPVSADVRTVTVGIYENAPKVFTSESGKPSGIFVDIIEDMAKSEGWNLRYVPGTWAEGLDRLAKGEIDLMPDVAYTTDREKMYSFHEVPVLSSWSQVYASKGSNIQSILDLNGKRIVVLENSVQQKTFERLTNSFGLSVTLISVPDYKIMFEMVAKEQADAAITNRFYGLMHARTLGLEDTAIMFDPAELFFASPKGASGDLLEIIDRHLSDLKKDPQSAYYASLKRWTSEEVQFKLPAWLQILGPVLGVVLLMSLGGSFVLKHQVNARTMELKQINKEMEQRIAERTTELTAANNKLQEVDKLKSLFIASMSHELRTPLNSIIGFTGILLQGLAGPLNDEQRKQLGMVKGSSHHLLELITDIIDISKIEAGKISLSLGYFDLSSTAREVLESFQPAAGRKALKLTIEAPDRLQIRSDERRVRQVLVNLIGNAVKLTSTGEVSVAVKGENGSARVAVRDTGRGIRTEDMGRLFQFFSQITYKDTPKHEGTGLGLYLSKKLMNLLGGDIRAESEFGKGSVFTMILPLKEEEQK